MCICAWDRTLFGLKEEWNSGTSIRQNLENIMLNQIKSDIKGEALYGSTFMGYLM